MAVGAVCFDPYKSIVFQHGIAKFSDELDEDDKTVYYVTF